MATTRTFSWRTLVMQADPEWAHDSRVVPEYEFTSERGEPRTFKRDYTQSAIYSTEWGD